MGEPSTRGPYAKTRQRRASIVRAARDAFAELGYNEASLREIAGRAGITHAGLLHHFADKQALLTAVLADQDGLEQERVRSAGSTPSGSPAQVLLDLMSDHQQSPAVMRMWLEFAAAASRPDHPAHDYLVERYSLGRSQAARIPQGASLSAEAASFLLLAVMDGLQLQWLLDPGLDIIAPLKEFLALLELD